jgi:hypothetical protein
MPPTVVAETTGTIWSPNGRRAITVTSFTGPSQAMNVSAGVEDPGHRRHAPSASPRTFLATWHIASSGFGATSHGARRLHDLLGDGADDLLVGRDEVVTAHARLARGRRSGDYDHDRPATSYPLEPTTLGS